MAETVSILRRKAAPGRTSGTGPAGPERAMALAFGRAAQHLPGLGLRQAGAELARVQPAGLAALAGEAALVVLLSREGGPPGALVADAALTGALVEAATTGGLGPAAPDPRPPTRIDALIAAEFLDAALAELGPAAAELSFAAEAGGWRTGRTVPAAALPLLLEETALRLVRLDFGLAEGRRGALLLALPFGAPPPGAAAGFGAALAQAVLAARGEVRAVLARLPLTLEAVSGWTPGAVLPLPREALAQVRLEDIGGTPLAHGLLGKAGGARAVRIAMPETE